MLIKLDVKLGKNVNKNLEERVKCDAYINFLLLTSINSTNVTVD